METGSSQPALTGPQKSGTRSPGRNCSLSPATQTRFLTLHSIRMESGSPPRVGTAWSGFGTRILEKNYLSYPSKKGNGSALSPSAGMAPASLQQGEGYQTSGMPLP